MSPIRQYPRLLLFLAACVAAYVLFHGGYFSILDAALIRAPFASAFLSGILFSFGFSAPFATALFLELSPSLHPILGAVIGGVGAFLSDILIFQTMRSSLFADEVERIRSTVVIQRIRALFHHITPTEKLRTVVLWLLSCLVIASPFPDEIGVTLLSGMTKVSGRSFAFLALTLNTLGILVILLIGRL